MQGLYFYAYDDQGQPGYMQMDLMLLQSNDSHTATTVQLSYLHIGTWINPPDLVNTWRSWKNGLLGNYEWASYKNFVYKTVAEMNGKNPLDDKDAYGPALKK